MPYNFFSNTDCEYFPCHNITESKLFSCLFCFCPLYDKDCGGNYTILSNGKRDCSLCLIPHYNYDYIISKLKKGEI